MKKYYSRTSDLIISLNSLQAWSFFMLLLSSADFFFTNTPFMNTIRESHGLDPDQDRHYVGADSGPN